MGAKVNDEKKDNTLSFTPRQMLEKVCNYCIPFVILISYVAITGAIYYTVEKHCVTTYSCSVTEVLVEYDATYVGVANQQQQSNNTTTMATSSTSSTTSPSCTLQAETVKKTVTRNLVQQVNKADLTYWIAFHYMAIIATTIGKFTCNISICLIVP